MKNLKTIMFILLLVTLIGGLAACGGEDVDPDPVIDNGDNGDNGDIDQGFYIESTLIEIEEEFYSIDASYPRLKGFPGAHDLSEIIDENIHIHIQRIVDDLAELAGEGVSPSLNYRYEAHYGYYENLDLVSLWLASDLYLGGPHGSYWLDGYTFNTKTGELYSFLDLFQHESGAIHIMDTILIDISENPDNFFESAFDRVWEYDYNFNFIIDGDILTVYFPFYDLAPYASGMSIYHFNCYDLEDGLKPEIFRAMRGQEPKQDLFEDFDDF